MFCSKHLATGDSEPPMKEGSIRLMSMAYCPYAQRVILAMLAKGITFDVVNVEMDNKPEWFVKRNPIASTVPTIDRDGQVLWESDIICNLLEEWYPDVPLYPNDPYKKAQDQVVCVNFSNKVMSSFYKVLLMPEDASTDTVDTIIQEFTQDLTKYNNELKTRGTKYFAGNDKPGMVDYLCWPWVEKIMFFDSMKAVCKTLPELMAYIDEMMKVKIIKDVIVKKENYLGFARSFAAGGKRKFDFD